MVLTAISTDALADAACADTDIEPDLFFPTTDKQAARAKAFCARCAARVACAAAAVVVARTMPTGRGHGLSGVWAGQLWHDGRLVQRVPRVGRPPALEAG